MSGSHKAWGGRFSGATAELMERFNASIGFDRRLLEVDVAGSKVYARALERAGLLTATECARILEGLDRVLRELSAPGHEFDPGVEDVHMAVEARLTEILGPLGGKLHAGRSRNDQVSLDERLYLRAATAAIRGRIRRLQAVLVASAEEHRRTVLPGYTHLQQAQPILFSHYSLSLFWALDRDLGRLGDAVGRSDRMPLGSGALAGSAFALDREFMARGAGVLGGDPQQPRRGLGPGLPPRGPGGALDPDDAPEPLLRGPGPVLLGGVRLRRARRRLGHRLEHDAPEEEPRLPGACARQDGGACTAIWSPCSRR